MMLSRLGKKMRSLLQKEISIEMRVATARQEREPMDISDEELLGQFRSISLDLEEAKRSARQGRMPAAQAHLVDHVRDRLRPRFFVHPANREKLLDQVKADEVPLQKLLKAAEEAQGRNFTRLGLRKQFPSAIDWFTATRHARPGAKASDQRPSRARRVSTIVATVGVPGGSATSSRAQSTRSRRLAK